MRKKFKEVSPWDTLNVQMMFHEVLNGAGLRKLVWNWNIYKITFTVKTGQSFCWFQIYDVECSNSVHFVLTSTCHFIKE